MEDQQKTEEQKETDEKLEEAGIDPDELDPSRQLSEKLFFQTVSQSLHALNKPMEMNIQNEKCSKCGRLLSPGMVAISSGSTVASLAFCLHCSASTSTEMGSDPQDFKSFIYCLSIAYREFCLNQIIHAKLNGGDYDQFTQQWDTILIALELDYKIWLAKILERRPDCLKNYKFEGEHEITVDNLLKWRKEFLAHYDSSTLRNWENFTREYALDPDSIKSLFDKIIEVADQYSRNVSPRPKERFRQIREKLSNEWNAWYKASTG